MTLEHPLAATLRRRPNVAGSAAQLRTIAFPAVAIANRRALGHRWAAPARRRPRRAGLACIRQPANPRLIGPLVSSRGIVVPRLSHAAPPRKASAKRPC